jgi:hypothetical protein
VPRTTGQVDATARLPAPCARAGRAAAGLASTPPAADEDGGSTGRSNPLAVLAGVAASGACSRPPSASAAADSTTTSPSALRTAVTRRARGLRPVWTAACRWRAEPRGSRHSAQRSAAARLEVPQKMQVTEDIATPPLGERWSSLAAATGVRNDPFGEEHGTPAPHHAKDNPYSSARAQGIWTRSRS